ncbi:MAG: hypothetical protein GX306_02760 [Clostridiales bacterium]|nr:hypothetical protein [Clostridiales bacterium]
MNEIFYIDIDKLGLSQLYLNQDKVQNISAWFDPSKIDEYEPLPVHDFWGNGKYVLTDGHTRAFLYYKSGCCKIPVMIDHDEIVTCDIGRRLYQEYVEWCNRNSVYTVKDLESRIITSNDYEFLWIERCARVYNLFNAIEEGTIGSKDIESLKKIGKDRDLFLYGASNNVSSFCYEDKSGNLWLYQNEEFIREYDNQKK